jgi:trehalose 6-phosphate synthase/phosphatase
MGEGLLGADLIGFHIYDYARHFLSSCLRLLGIPSHQGLLEYDGRTVKADAYPIGIDYGKFTDALQHKETKKSIETIQKSNKHQKLIVSVDRLDYTKGIPERLEAFRLLLEKYPEYIGKVRLLMVEVPSRTEVETYKNLRDTIEQAVSRINGMYGTVDWAPISYQFQNLPFNEIVALFAAADVALVTPIRDGMNLVAKEYLASKQKSPGVLILSEMAGAIDELPEALGINPGDTHLVAEAMHEALEMPKKEQLRRLGVMQRRLRSYTVQAWGEDFMNDLTQAGSARQMQHKKRMSAESRAELTAAFKQASTRLILLDYDGTLRKFVSTPRASAAKPTREVLKLLKKLTNDPKNQVAIVSGRPKKTLQGWFKGIRLTLAAEHGAYTRYDEEWVPVEDDFRPIKKQLRPILEKYVSRTAGSEIEEKDFALVWHYRNVAPELAFVRANELRRELEESLTDDSIGVFSGNKIVEIKPADINKGTIAAELDAVYQPDFVLCAGDDYTDEDMFGELSDSTFTIKIGPGDTKARFQLASIEELLKLLEELTAAE